MGVWRIVVWDTFHFTLNSFVLLSNISIILESDETKSHIKYIKKERNICQSPCVILNNDANARERKNDVLMFISKYLLHLCPRNN